MGISIQTRLTLWDKSKVTMNDGFDRKLAPARVWKDVEKQNKTQQPFQSKKSRGKMRIMHLTNATSGTRKWLAQSKLWENICFVLSVLMTLWWLFIQSVPRWAAPSVRLFNIFPWKTQSPPSGPFYLNRIPDKSWNIRLFQHVANRSIYERNKGLILHHKWNS